MARRKFQSIAAETGPLENAQFEFDMPRLTGAEPALVSKVAWELPGAFAFSVAHQPRVPSRVER